MVVKPNECNASDNAFRMAVQAFENHIDINLKKNWYSECPELKIDYSHSLYTGCQDTAGVQRKIISMYAEHGWTLRFSSNSYRNETDYCIYVKLTPQRCSTYFPDDR